MDEFREARVDRLIESIPVLTRIFRYGEWESVLRAPKGVPGGGRFVGKGDFMSMISRVDDDTQVRVKDLLDVSASIREKDGLDPAEARPRLRARQATKDRAIGAARGAVSAGRPDPESSEARAKEREIEDAKALAGFIGRAPFTREGSGELRTRQGEATKAGGGVTMPAGATVGAGRSGVNQDVISSETNLTAATDKYDRANASLRSTREKVESLKVKAMSLRQQANEDEIVLPDGMERAPRTPEGEIRAARERTRLIRSAEKLEAERDQLLIKVQDQTEQVRNLGADVDAARASRDAARDAARNIGTGRERERLIASDLDQEERRRVAAGWSRSAAYSQTIMANWHRRNDDALNAAREAAKDQERARGVTSVKDMDASGFHADPRVKLAMDDLKKQFAEFTVDGEPYSAVAVPDIDEVIGAPPSPENPKGTFSPTRSPWFDREPPWSLGGWKNGDSLENDVKGWIYNGNRDKKATVVAEPLTLEKRLEMRRMTLGRTGIQDAARLLMTRGDPSLGGPAAVFMDTFEYVLAEDNPQTVEALKASFSKAVTATKKRLITDERQESFATVSQFLNTGLQNGIGNTQDEQIRDMMDQMSGRFSDPREGLRTIIGLINEEISDNGRVKGVPKAVITRRAQRRRMLSQFGITDLKTRALRIERDARQKQIDDFRSNEPDRLKAGVPIRPGSKIRKGTATPEELESSFPRARAGVMVAVTDEVDVRGKDVRYVVGIDNKRDSVMIIDRKSGSTEVLDVRGKRVIGTRSRDGEMITLKITGMEEREREAIPGAPSSPATMRWDGQGGAERSKNQSPLRVKRRRALSDQLAALRIERKDPDGARFEKMKDYASPEAESIQSARAEVKSLPGFAQEVTERRQRITQIDMELSGMPSNWTRRREPLVGERKDLVSQIDTFFANAQRQVGDELDRMQQPSLGDAPTPAATLARMEVRRLEIQVQIDAIDSVMWRKRAVRNPDDPRARLVIELFGADQTPATLGKIRDDLKSELNGLTGKITTERVKIGSSDAKAALDAIDAQMKRYDERGLMTSDRRRLAEKVSAAISDLIIKRPPVRKDSPRRAAKPSTRGAARKVVGQDARARVTSPDQVTMPTYFLKNGFKSDPTKETSRMKRAAFVMARLVRMQAATSDEEKAMHLQSAIETFANHGVRVKDLEAIRRDGASDTVLVKALDQTGSDVKKVRITKLFREVEAKYPEVPASKPKPKKTAKKSTSPAAKKAPVKRTKRTAEKRAPARRTTSTGELRPSQKPRVSGALPPLATAPVPEGGLTDAALNTRLRLLVLLLSRGDESAARQMFTINGFTSKQVRDWARRNRTSVRIPRSFTKS